VRVVVCERESGRGREGKGLRVERGEGVESVGRIEWVREKARSSEIVVRKV